MSDERRAISNKSFAFSHMMTQSKALIGYRSSLIERCPIGYSAYFKLFHLSSATRIVVRIVLNTLIECSPCTQRESPHSILQVTSRGYRCTLDKITDIVGYQHFVTTEFFGVIRDFRIITNSYENGKYPVY